MPEAVDTFVFPEPPSVPEEMINNFLHLSVTGNSTDLAGYLGHPDSTLVVGDCYISPDIPIRMPERMKGLRYPDMLVAFGVDPKEFRKRRAYVISEQGKPPDFVLEVASESTGDVDVDEKPFDYARLGIGEYWRFDEFGSYHGKRLAGDRLVAGRYEPMPIKTISDGVLQGHSPVLNVNLRWDHGELMFYDPATGLPIPSRESERQGRLEAEAREESQRQGRLEAEASRDSAQRALAAAEARVRELEERLRSQDSQAP